MVERNFLFVSIDGLIGDIAWRVQQQGHNVRYSIRSEFSQDVSAGFVERVADWEEHVDWADVIVFDDAFGLGAEAERLRAEGHAVVGGTELTDRLEEDRGFATDMMADHGINTIPHRIFSDFDEAISFVEQERHPYVIKPNGEAQNFKELLYVGRDDDGGDVVQVLETYRDKWSDEVDSFQLQRRVHGVEVAVCAYFNGEEFVTPVNFNFEHKPLCSGGVGPMTGEMGTHMFWTGPNQLFRETLKPMEPLLREEGYVGSFDMNCIVNDDGIHPLEFSPRFGYPSVFIQEEGMKTPVADFLHDLAHGNDPDLEVHDGFQVGARICMPPFPFDDEEVWEQHSKDTPVRFRDPERTGVHIEDVKQDDDGTWRVAGATGEILTVTGKGSSMDEARRRMYDRVENVVVPHMIYRNDIGERWAREHDKLHTWGYLRRS